MAITDFNIDFMIKSKSFQLVFILAIVCAILATVKGKSQTLTFHRDSTAQGMTYVNALATDSANMIISQPVKVVISIHDYGDSVHGACFQVTAYSISYIRCITFFDKAINVNGSIYNNWDANNDSQRFFISQAALQTAGIYLTWQD